MNCQCCNHEVKIKFSNTRYCSRCSLHRTEQGEEVNALKQKIKKLKEKTDMYVATLQIKRGRPPRPKDI